MSTYGIDGEKNKERKGSANGQFLLSRLTTFEEKKKRRGRRILKDSRVPFDLSRGEMRQSTKGKKAWKGTILSVLGGDGGKKN